MPPADISPLNVPYDPTRELYAEFNNTFAASYRKETGKSVEVKQSHGGAGAQAHAVIDGRELIPLMQEQGTHEEEAALSLGASGLRTFLRITLPNVKWGLLYGVLLCNARAMGEFGAVSVVSGLIRGETNTMPPLVEILYNEYQLVAAFAIASLLAMLALVTLMLDRHLVERQVQSDD